MVMKIGIGFSQAFLVPPGISLGTKKIRPHVIVNTVNLPSLFSEK
jgi:hypothetical protein